MYKNIICFLGIKFGEDAGHGQRLEPKGKSTEAVRQPSWEPTLLWNQLDSLTVVSAMAF